MTWISVLAFGAIGQAILMVAQFTFAKRNQQQYLLISLFLILAFYLFHETVVYNRLILKWTFPYGWGSVFPLLIAPLLYLYVSSLIDSKFSFNKKTLIHFVPATIALISRYDIILMPRTEKIARLSSIFGRLDKAPTFTYFEFTFDTLTHFVLWHLQPLVYFALIIYIMYKKKDITISLKKLTRWIKLLSFGLFFYFLADYISEVLMNSSQVGLRSEIQIPIFSLYIFFLCLIILVNQNTSYVVKPISKDQLQKKEIDMYFEKLEKLVQLEKPFLNPQLQLSDLANKVGLPSRELSQVIKTNKGVSFSDYINQLRIEYSQNILRNPEFQSLTIQAIGEQSGFQSKDAFYRSFKKFTQTTPKAYLTQFESPNT